MDEYAGYAEQAEDPMTIPQAPQKQPAPTALKLYAVDGRGRLALGDLIPDGVQHYTATVDGNRIYLDPVIIQTTIIKRSAAE